MATLNKKPVSCVSSSFSHSSERDLTVNRHRRRTRLCRFLLSVPRWTTRPSTSSTFGTELTDFDFPGIVSHQAKLARFAENRYRRRSHFYRFRTFRAHLNDAVPENEVQTTTVPTTTNMFNIRLGKQVYAPSCSHKLDLYTFDLDHTTYRHAYCNQCSIDFLTHPSPRSNRFICPSIPDLARFNYLSSFSPNANISEAQIFGAFHSLSESVTNLPSEISRVVCELSAYFMDSLKNLASHQNMLVVKIIVILFVLLLVAKVCTAYSSVLRSIIDTVLGLFTSNDQNASVREVIDAALPEDATPLPHAQIDVTTILGSLGTYMSSVTPILGTIACVVGMGKLPNSRLPSFDVWMKRICEFPKFCSSLTTIRDWLSKMWRHLSTWFQSQVLGIDVIIEDGKIVEYESWRTELLAALEPGAMQHFNVDVGAAHSASTLWIRGIHLLRRLDPVLTPKLKDEFKSVLVLANQLRVKLEPLTVPTAGARQAPLMVFFVGASAIGKSTFQYPLSIDLLKSLGLAGNWRENIYSRVTEQEYWDNWKDQPIVWIDDAFQRRDTVANPNLEIFETIRMSNTAIFPLHSASIEQKGNATFRARACIYTSNTRSPSIESITHQDAFYRRFSHCYEIRIKPEFQRVLGGAITLDVEKAVRELPVVAGVSDPINLNVYEFVRYDPVTERNTVLTDRPGIGYDELVATLTNSLNVNVSRERVLNDFLDRRAGVVQAQVDTDSVNNDDSDEFRSVTGDEPSAPVRDSDYIAGMETAVLRGLFDDVPTIATMRTMETFDLAAEIDRLHTIAPAIQAFAEYCHYPDVDRLGLNASIRETLSDRTAIVPVFWNWCGTFAKVDSFDHDNEEYARFFCAGIRAIMTPTEIEPSARIQAHLDSDPVLGSVFTVFHDADVTVERTINVREATTTAEGTQSRIREADNIIGVDQRLFDTPHVWQSIIARNCWLFWSRMKHRFASLEPIRKPISFIPDCMLAFTNTVLDGISTLLASYLTPLFAQYGGIIDVFQRLATSGAFYVLIVGLVTILVTFLKRTATYVKSLLTKENFMVPAQAADTPMAGAMSVLAHAATDYEQVKNCKCEDFPCSHFWESHSELYSAYSRPVTHVALRPANATPHAEAFHDQNHTDVCTIIANNQYQMFYTLLGDRKKMGTLTVIRGTMCLIPAHFLSFFRGIDDATIRTITITLISPKNATFNIRLDNFVRNARPVPNLDFVIVDLFKTLNPHKDILDHFSTKADVQKITRTTASLIGTAANNNLVTHDWASGDIQVQTDTKYTLPTLSGEVTVTKVARTYAYSFPTKTGDCGKLLVAASSLLTGRCIGMHVAGSSDGTTTTNYSSAIDRDDLLAVLTQFPKAQVFTNEVTEPVQDFILESHFTPIAKLPPVSENRRSTIMRSSVYGMFGPIPNAPAHLGPFMDKNNEIIDPLPKALLKASGVTPAISYGQVDIAQKDLFRLLLESPIKRTPTVYDFRTAVTGLPEDPLLAPINRTTSPGYPWCLTNRKRGKTAYLGDSDYVFDGVLPEKLQAETHALIESCKRGIVPRVVWLDTLKDELRPHDRVDAGKTRAFAIGPQHFTIAFRMYFLSFTAWMMENRVHNECAVGINAYSHEWTQLYRHLQSRGKEVVAGDYSNFDGTLLSYVLWAVLDIINDWYNDEHTLTRIALFCCIVHSTHLVRGVLYQWTHSQPSGCPITSILNCLYNSIIIRTAFLLLCPIGFDISHFTEHVTMISYGDDNVINVSPIVSPWFHQGTITRALAELGMTYTDESKSGRELTTRTIEEVTFIKRSFRYDYQFNRRFAPLPLDHIMSILNYTSKSRTTDQLDLEFQQVQSVYTELAQHGESIFDEKVSKIEEAYFSTARRLPTNRGYIQYLNNPVAFY